MKQSTIKIIEDKFKDDIAGINYEIRKNKREIKRISRKAKKKLKDTRTGLYDILRLIRG